MIRTIRFAALAAGLSLIAAPAFAASPVVGTWATVADTDFGRFEATLTVAETADGYSVEFVDVPAEGAPPVEMESEISDVKVDGANFSFTRKLTTPQGPFTLAYTGTVDGDALTAQANSDFGAIPVTGTRQ